MGGNPLNLRALALEMGIDQPFYGLQPQGLDGMSKSAPDRSPRWLRTTLRKSGVTSQVGHTISADTLAGASSPSRWPSSSSQPDERIGSLVFLDSIAPGVELPSLLDRLDMHIAKLREEGVDHFLNFLKWAADRRIKNGGAILRKPLRRLFPYRYRIETIADTWNEAFAAYQPTPYAGDAMLFRASTASCWAATLVA